MCLRAAAWRPLACDAAAAPVCARRYNTTKGAIVQLSRCAALDCGEDGIRVNCVCPGPIYTEARAAGAGVGECGV